MEEGIPLLLLFFFFFCYHSVSSFFYTSYIVHRSSKGRSRKGRPGIKARDFTALFMYTKLNIIILNYNRGVGAMGLPPLQYLPSKCYSLTQ